MPSRKHGHSCSAKTDNCSCICANREWHPRTPRRLTRTRRYATLYTPRRRFARTRLARSGAGLLLGQSDVGMSAYAQPVYQRIHEFNFVFDGTELT